MRYNSCHLWLPNVFEFKGGIQVYSTFLIQALADLSQDFTSDIFLKHDTKVTFNIPGQPQVHFAGTYPLPWRTGIFTSQILTAGIIQRPELIITTHVNFTPAAYLLKQLTGIPYWAVAHGVDSWNIQNPLLRQALRHADRILPVSSYTRDRLLKEQNLDPSQLSVLPNTFDGQRWQISPKPQYLLDRYHLNSQQPTILTVSRLDSTERYKGYDRVIDALPQIRNVLPDVHYLLVGKGSDYARIEKKVDDLGLSGFVTLTGFVSDEELCDHYNLCDVFALPSKTEGFGIVYLEALACGKPCLGGNQDGAKDALCQGKLGALVNPESVDEIAQALIKILQKNNSDSSFYNPEELRCGVIEAYGFQEFKKTLKSFLS